MQGTLTTMSEYRPPVSEIAFILKHVVGYPDIARLPGYEHADLDTVMELLEQCGEFMADVVAPTNRAGDTRGSRWQPRRHRGHAPGFKEAYHQYVDAGWGACRCPRSSAAAASRGSSARHAGDDDSSANMAFALCPLLTQGAIDALLHHGSEEQQERYLPKMVTGEWTGTMNLTEPQAGSDVGALTHPGRAAGRRHVPHQRAEDLHHLRRARHGRATSCTSCWPARPARRRAPRASPASSCRSSWSNEDGSLGERNDVTCVSIEHKMGIHGQPHLRAVLGDDGGAVGYLIGEENHGMRDMFTMMNNARLVGRARRASPSPSAPTSRRWRTPRSAGRAGRSARPRRRRRSSSTPTCAACCMTHEGARSRPARR